VVASRSVGRFSIKDIEIASGEAPPPATGEAPSLATIEAAVMDCDLAALTATVAALQACRESLAGLEAAIVAQVSAADAPNFGKLPAMLRKAEMFLGAKLAERAPATPGADGAGAGAVNGEAAGAGRGGGAAPRAFAGAVTSRDDVVKALDAICTYYAKHEPSSPIPIFMERCKRMVMMSFVDIVKELVPDAVSKLDVLRGNVE
jgi:type VI secretion system protein ImpA